MKTFKGVQSMGKGSQEAGTPLLIGPLDGEAYATPRIGQLNVERDYLESLRSLSHGRRTGMLEAKHPRLSISRQCELVSIARSSYYYTGKGENALNLLLMREIDEEFLRHPFYGSRQMAKFLRR